MDELKLLFLSHLEQLRFRVSRNAIAEKLLPLLEFKPHLTIRSAAPGSEFGAGHLATERNLFFTVAGLLYTVISVMNKGNGSILTQVDPSSG